MQVNERLLSLHAAQLNKAETCEAALAAYVREGPEVEVCQ